MKILITAGPTREPLDPVRFISNRSSGRMGYALALAAVERGHEVVLVSGPVELSAPSGVAVVRVTTAQEMHEAVRARIKDQHVGIFAAAVADYRPVRMEEQKIKKGASRMTLELEKTPDILGSARSVFGFKGVLIGFAAETENLVANATQKMTRKMCDLVVANHVGGPDSAFDSDMNEITICTPQLPPQPFRRETKVEVARLIVERAEEMAVRKFGKTTPS
ncbi:MAG: phosphopantothenoylcysteine decarboxylase [Verrucomicrobiaceae bacterium]|nr:phosphopantothenoylcysteine decarboxylase [Verrucomicrobiaceae bacterium]